MKRTAKPPFPPNDEKMSPTESKVAINLTLNVSQWAYIYKEIQTERTTDEVILLDIHSCIDCFMFSA